MKTTIVALSLLSWPVVVNGFLAPNSIRVGPTGLMNDRIALRATVIAPPSTPTGQKGDIDSPPILSEESVESEKEKFDWFKSWYPLVPVEILNPEIPHQFQLLGMDVVVWNDGVVEGHNEFASKKKRTKGAKRTEGNWRVFVDACPHRKVPLSEGRVEDDGSLLCSYHGWRFDGEGEVVDIPQFWRDDNDAKEPSPRSPLERVQCDPRSRCNAFPVQVVDGVLWVWPATGDDARLESALASVPNYQIPETVNEERIWYGNWNYRELPYSADYFIENVVDPAHVTISHHGVVGNRYDDQNVKVESLSPVTKKGFAVQVTTKSNVENPSSTTFTAPCTVAIESPFGKDGAFQSLELYATPSRPGYCHHVGRMVIARDESNITPPLLRQFTLPLPTWFNHVMAASFLNQDALFLHAQERYLAKTSAYVSHVTPGEDQKYGDAVLPITADMAVMRFRSWLSRLAGGYIPYKNGDKYALETTANPEVCFDQYNSHTSKCQICQTALSNLRKVRAAALFVSVSLLVLVRPVTLGKRIAQLAGVLATSGFAWVIHQLIGRFYKAEFSHSHND